MTFGVKPLVIIPDKGDLTKVLKEKCIPYEICFYKPWVTREKNMFKNAASYACNLLAAYYISMIAKKSKIDLIHTNSSAVNVGALAAKISKIPHIWHIREFLKEDYNLEFKSGWKKSVDFINNNSDVVIAISDKIAEKYKNDVEKGKLRTIYNGISLKDVYLTREAVSNQLNQVVLLLVGVIIPNKGQEEAILAVKKLVDEGFTNVVLNIVGDGDYKPTLEIMVVELNLKNNIKFLGYISDVNEVRANSNIALMCSKAEAFGRTTIEAMLAKLPVVGANSGATSELIINGETGYLYEQGNYIDLADKIKQLLIDFDKINQFGLQGYERAKKYFTADRNAMEIMQIYNEVTQNRNVVLIN